MGNDNQHSRRRPVVHYDARLAIERPAYARSRLRAQTQREENDARRAELLQRMGKKDTGQSLVDLQAAYRGTNASEGSEEFDRAFARDADGKPTGNKPEAWRQRFEQGGPWAKLGPKSGLPSTQPAAGAGGNPQGAPTPQPAHESQQSPDSQAPQTSQDLPSPPTTSMVSNPPPATNFGPGDAGRNSLADARTVAYSPPPNFRRDKNGVPVDSPEQIARANKEWLDSGMGKHVVSTTEKPRVRPEAELNSRKMQALLDANVNPGAQQEVARAVAAPGRSVGTQYGSISVRNGAGDPKNADGSLMAEAVPTRDGVSRDTANVWQQQVMKMHPEIGQRDSEANKAFVAAWKEAGARQGPNSDGSAGVDPMKIAQRVTQDLATRREEEKKIAAQQQAVMKAYPEVGQQGSEASKQYTAAWQDGAWQGPNPDGSAGADPMKVAEKVTQDLGKQRELMYAQQARNFLDPRAKIPMTNSTVSLGDQVKVAPPATSETIPVGVKGPTLQQEKAVPQFKSGDIVIGRKPAENAGVDLGKVSIGTTPFSQAKLPSEATSPVSNMVGSNPSLFVTPKVNMPGVPALPEVPIGRVDFFGGPSAPIGIPAPGGISKVDPFSPITWGGMGAKADLTLKDKSKDNASSQFVAKP